MRYCPKNGISYRASFHNYHLEHSNMDATFQQLSSDEPFYSKSPQSSLQLSHPPAKVARWRADLQGEMVGIDKVYPSQQFTNFKDFKSSNNSLVSLSNIEISSAPRPCLRCNIKHQNSCEIL